jgi:ABC-type lipoprotein release transport system permease subunit
MTLRTLILRSLRFHLRAHLGVLLGATLGSAILIGALLVGDSVRGSLRDMALARLGNIHYALDSGDRLFRTELSDDIHSLGKKFANVRASEIAPALAFHGTATTSDGATRANRVRLLGVDGRLGKLAGDSRFGTIPEDGVLLNEALAAQLRVKRGDTVILRAPKPSALSKDTPHSPQADSTLTLRLQVHDIVAASALGNFNLAANQIAPFNAFVSLAALQKRISPTNAANLLVTADWQAQLGRPISPFEKMLLPFFRTDDNRLFGRKVYATSKLGTNGFDFIDTQMVELPYASASPSELTLSRPWKLADYQLDLRLLTNSPALELRTDRIFLDPPAVRAALAVDTNAQPILTYLATLLRAGTNATAYPMITAAGAPLVPADLRDDEIAVNQWLADQLQLKPGGELELSYFLPDSGARLTEATNRFRVRSIVPMQMPWADRTLMPDFPGIASAERIGDWDAGFPLTHRKLVDDPYWKQWRGTPKAFVSLSAGRKMWGNRFGDTTAVRFPQNSEFRIPNGESAATNARTNSQFAIRNSQLEKALLTALKPSDFGLVFQPVREQALKASREGQDFGGLFIGFSFFLIVAACVLVALLFQFGVEQRAKEVGTLLALGFTPKQVRRLLLGEGAGLAVLGAALGAVGAVWYARAMLHGLSTVWRDAVGTSDLRFHAEPATLAGGFVGAVAVAVFSLWLALRKQVRQPARVLLAGGGEEVISNQFSVISGEGDARLGLRRQAERDAALTSRGAEQIPTAPPEPKAPSPLRSAGAVQDGRMNLVGAACSVVALALLGWAVTTGQTANAGAFFGAGALLLIAALAFTSALLTRLERSESAAALTVSGLGIRNITRRRSRSLATATMLACGSFLVLSIGVFRLDENANATQRSSGTGGFALLGESTLPVVQDLNTKAGREALGLDESLFIMRSPIWDEDAPTNSAPEFMDVLLTHVVPFRVRDGDDASCLNLNRAQKPRLLGVKPELLAAWQAFTFTEVAKGLAKKDGWMLLKPSAGGHAGPLTPALSPVGGEGEEARRTSTNAAKTIHIPQTLDARPASSAADPIPAIADMNSILWAMGKKVGDIIEYPEPDERGRPLRLRLVGAVANSILQGNLIIAEDEFTARFPSEAGYRYFLVGTLHDPVSDVSATLTRALRDFGLELTPATRRMAQLNAVQNTYLGTFQILGGLGLLLGSAGLGVVVLRNVLERRGELALLLALGFRAKALRWLVLSEHAALLLLGLLSGVVAAGVAVLPSVLGAGVLPIGALALTLGGVLVSGLVWTWLATVSALRGQLLDALRNQ